MLFILYCYLIFPPGIIGECLEISCECVLSHFSRVQLFVTSWIVTHQAPLPKEFSRQEYWTGVPFPIPGDLPYLGSNPSLLHLLQWQTDSLPLAPPENPKTVNFLLYVFHHNFLKIYQLTETRAI